MIMIMMIMIMIMKTLYATAKQLSRQFNSTNHQVRDLWLSITNNERETTQKIIKHFQQLLNRPPQCNL